MDNYCKEHGIYCEVATDLGFCSVTGCIKQNQVSNIAIIPTVTVTDMPMVEYAPVVRCVKCESWKEFDNKMKGLCRHKNHIMTTTSDFFCADGRRKRKSNE